MTRLKFMLIFSGLCIMISLVGLFSTEKLYSPIIGFVGINGFYIGIAATHIYKTNSAKVFGGYLLLIMLLYLGVNSIRQNVINHLLYSLEGNRYVVQTFLITYLAGLGVYRIVSGGEFSQISRNRFFKFSMILLALYLLTEMPIYNIHGDFGGNYHGHSFWKTFHFH